MTNELGRQIGRFRLLGVLGAGGFATVYRAEDTQLGREVALKLLHAHLAGDDVFRRRFLAEARAAARLHHPHIVAIHEVGETDDGRPYIVMPLLEGTLLSQLIAERAPLPFAEAEATVGQLASALDYLHSQGLVHRDLKPANVMVSDGGDVTLMDFGIARSVEEQARLTQTGQLVGTPAYMAPEQIAGDEAGPASDIYSLGIVTYEMFAGRPPFTGNQTSVIRAQLDAAPPPIAGFNPNVSPAAADAIERALAKDPAARPPTAIAFADLLNGDSPTEVLPRPVAPVPVAAPVPAPMPVVSRPYTWVYVAAGFVALIIVALLLLLVTRRGGSSSSTSTTAALAPASSASAPAVATTAAAVVTPTAARTATASPSPRPTPSPTPRSSPTPTATPSPTPSPTPAPSQTADARVASALNALPASTSAAFLDVTPNVIASHIGQNPVAAGDTALLLLGETAEELLRQGRLLPTQQFTIQPADVAGQSGPLANQAGRPITTSSLLRETLVANDPIAANILIRAVGGLNAINAEAQRLGLNQTRVTRGFRTPAAGAAENVTSTNDLAMLMSDLAAHRGIDPTPADDLLGLLRLRVNQAPSAVTAALPAGSIVVGLDSGTAAGSVWVGLLSLPNGNRGALAVSAPGSASGSAQQIGNVARQVLQVFNP